MFPWIGAGIGFVATLVTAGGLVAFLRSGRSLALWIPAVGVTLALGCTGTLLVPWSGYYLVSGLQSTGWSTTTGRITESYTKVVRQRSGRRHRSHRETSIRYEYQVDGRRIAGSTLAFAADDGYPGILYLGDATRAEAMVADHPEGASVTVAYDPGWPSSSVLEPGVQTSEAVRMGIGLASLVVCALSLLLLARDPTTERVLDMALGRA